MASAALMIPLAIDCTKPKLRRAKARNCCLRSPSVFDKSMRNWSICFMALSLGKIFNAGNVAGLMFKIMDFADVALLNYLFPFTRKQTPQLTQYGFVMYRVFQGAALDRRPALRHRSGDVRIKVERHVRSMTMVYLIYLETCLIY